MTSPTSMMKNLTKAAATACTLGAIGLLVGCQTPTKPLYQWTAYQPQVYQHFKGESPLQQIDALEKDLQVMKSAGNAAPPGFHAHLGMLYAMVGRSDQVSAEFDSEKRLFPESAAYMDLLLQKTKKGTQ